MHGPRSHFRGGDAESIHRRVTKMLKAGRVTPEEAERVLSAADSQELEQAVGTIRLRHVRTRLAADMREGRLTQEEADSIISRVQRGEHPRLPSRFRRSGRTDQSAADS